MDEGPLRKIFGELGIRPHRARDWLNAVCPFAPYLHPAGRDRHPSFGALIVQNGVSVYKCYSCKKTGRISSLVRSLEHYRCESYPGLALEADMADMTTDFGTFERPDMGGGSYDDEDPVLEEAAYGDLYPPAWDYPEARAYLEGRGIGGGTAAELELRWDDQEARVLFTTRNVEGGLLGWSGRTVLVEGQYPYAGYPKVRDYQGLPKRNLLLGAHRLRPGMPLVVVEGLFGYAHLVEQGVRAIADIVALLGSEFTPVKEGLVKAWNRATYLLVDNDDGGEGCLFGPVTLDGGRRGGAAVDKLYGHVPLYIPAWPGRWDNTEKQDPDELTFAEVEHIIQACPPYVRPVDPLQPVAR